MPSEYKTNSFGSWRQKDSTIDEKRTKSRIDALNNGLNTHLFFVASWVFHSICSSIFQFASNNRIVIFPLSSSQSKCVCKIRKVSIDELYEWVEFMFGYTIDIRQWYTESQFHIYRLPKGIIELKIHKYDLFLHVAYKVITLIQRQTFPYIQLLKDMKKNWKENWFWVDEKNTKLAIQVHCSITFWNFKLRLCIIFYIF